MQLPNQWRRLRAVAALLFVVFAIVVVARQWEDVRAAAGNMDLRWFSLVLATLTVALAYLLLIETWRRTVIAWGSRIQWRDAAGIWFVSNLGRYVPGKIWQIGAMGVMATERGVSPVAATGSALVVNLVSVIAGLVVVIATGGRVLARYAGAWTAFGLVLLAALAVFPVALPLVARVVRRLTGRELALGALPPRALAVALLGTTAAWLLYGFAFRWFVQGVGIPLLGGPASYTAAYTFSYLLGYLVLLVPGGIGVREGALVASMTQLGLASVGEATIVAVTSRLWLTLLEVAPGATLLASAALRRSSQPLPDDGD
ncbi:MAG: lysylphosphatidylglycerol synthase domain-containing protein [Gemmatimonadaceae bacterium]